MCQDFLDKNARPCTMVLIALGSNNIDRDEDGSSGAATTKQVVTCSCCTTAQFLLMFYSNFCCLMVATFFAIRIQYFDVVTTVLAV